jgi:hypothetical protein
MTARSAAFLVMIGILSSTSTGNAQSNFDLLRVDDFVQTTGALGVSAFAFAPVPPFTAVGGVGGAGPVYGETDATFTGLWRHARAGNNVADALLSDGAHVPTLWDGITATPQANIEIGAITSAIVPAGSAGFANSNWVVGPAAQDNTPLRAIGDFGVLPVPGQPDLVNGTLYGQLDIILVPNVAVSGAGQATFWNNQSTFGVQAGNSALNGIFNTATNNWTVVGVIVDEFGTSHFVNAFYPPSMNVIYEVAEPSAVGHVHRVSATASMGAFTQTSGTGTANGIWSVSILAWFEVNIDP